MQVLKILNLSGELSAKKYEKERDLSFLIQQLLKQLQNRKFWRKKKKALGVCKSFVTFEMLVKTIFHSVNYEGPQSW